MIKGGGDSTDSIDPVVFTNYDKYNLFKYMQVLFAALAQALKCERCSRVRIARREQAHGK